MLFDPCRRYCFSLPFPDPSGYALSAGSGGPSRARGETLPDFMVLTLVDTVPPSYWTLVQWKPYRHHGSGSG